MQEQCIPIQISQISQALPIFLQQANAAGLRFQEIQDVRDVDEVVLTMEGGPYQEYFYIQIPVGKVDGRVMNMLYISKILFVLVVMPFWLDLCFLCTQIESRFCNPLRPCYYST
jgi:hypothetical protein